MIPNVLHLYWGRNKPLSLLRYMTVTSFAKLNPGWEIIVHYPEEPYHGITWKSREHRGKSESHQDYFQLLQDVDGCETRQIDTPKCAEVMRSDFARWQILADGGGWWSDFDILYVKPMSQLSIPEGVEVVTVRQVGRTGDNLESIGFIGANHSKYASDFFNEVLLEAHRNWTPHEYQSAGRFAFAPVLNKAGGKALVLPPHIVYPIQSWEVHRLYKQSSAPLHEDTIGIHWFGGFSESQKFERLLEQGKAHRRPTWLAAQIRNGEVPHVEV